MVSRYVSVRHGYEEFLLASTNFCSHRVCTVFSSCITIIINIGPFPTPYSLLSLYPRMLRTFESLLPYIIIKSRLCASLGEYLLFFPQIMTNSETGEPRYLSDGYELENFELPVSDDVILECCMVSLSLSCILLKMRIFFQLVKFTWS